MFRKALPDVVATSHGMGEGPPEIWLDCVDELAFPFQSSTDSSQSNFNRWTRGETIPSRMGLDTVLPQSSKSWRLFAGTITGEPPGLPLTSLQGSSGHSGRGATRPSRFQGTQRGRKRGKPKRHLSVGNRTNPMTETPAAGPLCESSPHTFSRPSILKRTPVDPHRKSLPLARC